MKQRYFFALVACMLSALGFAQVSVKIQAPRQTEVGEQIRVSYIVNTKDVKDFNVGEFTGFKVLYGPSTSSSSSYSISNGKTTSNSSMTFTYTIVAKEEGTFQLPVASALVKGNTYKSDTAEIEVLPPSKDDSPADDEPQSSNSQSARSRSSSSDGISAQDLYITVTASKKRIYEQEAVLLTYKLYSLVDIRQLAGEMPQLDNCHVQEVNAKAQMSVKLERVNGRNYRAGVWRQYVLFPQKAGRLKVPAITFDTQVEIQNVSMDPFDIFFNGGSLVQVVNKSITTPGLEIEVMPLPSPKPDNFSGAVGHFSLSGTLTPQQLKANDAATLRLIVSGQGNMKLMKAPKVQFPQDFEIYDPKTEDKTVNTSVGAKGNVIYDYVVVPRHGGDYEIPPVKFCYFDPDENEYCTLETDSFSISVEKGKGRTSVVTHEQEDLKVLSDDIHFIKLNRISVSDSNSLFFGSLRYWMVYLISFALFLLSLIVFYRQAKERANISKLRGRKAGREAAKRLRNASKLMKAQDSSAFYDEVMRALLGYAADKLNLPVSELNKDNVSRELTGRGVDESVVKAYLDVLSECEFARFAQGDANATMDKVFAEASEAINRLDAAIKK